MSKFRRAAKVDLNQKHIVDALRTAGASVEVGHDDILVGWNGRTYWYELKSENAVSTKTGEVLKSAKKPDQVRLEKEFKGHYRIVSSFHQIIDEVFG